MQIKKFEAPTIQEALDTIKRELGPEAIILQTKKYKRGFGLMSKASVEVTAAVSERSLQKKKFTETRLPEPSKDAVRNMPAERQAAIYDKYLDRHLATNLKQRDQVELSSRGKSVPQSQGKSGAGGSSAKRITATRYIDIDDGEPRRSGTGRFPGQAPARAAQAVNYGKAPVLDESGPDLSNLPKGEGAVAGKLGPSLGNAHSGMTMEEELKHLKRMVEEMKNAQDDSKSMGGAAGAQALVNAGGSLGTPALQHAFEQLVVNGLEKRYALGLVQRASFDLDEKQHGNPEAILDHIALELMQNTEIAASLSGIAKKGHDIGVNAPVNPAVIAVVGPTGVGKTTTVAKLAADAANKRGLKVGLINLDSHKAGAFDQLATFAKILNLPFRSAASAEDFRIALKDFQGMDLILVDTTGRSQRDPSSIREMQEMLAAAQELGVSLRTHLVLSATTRDTEMYDMASRFSVFRPTGIIVSKLDEATIYGSIYNVSQRAKLPLLYFTTGQRVPEDIEEATKERVASLILEI